MSARVRIATSLAIMAVAAAIGARGFGVARFAIADMSAPSDRAARVTAADYVDTPGLRLAARRRAAAPDQDGAGRIATDRALLAVAPLSSAIWLDLAEARRREAAIDPAIRAYMMSVLTGRNEGVLMPARASVGVALWPRLAPEGRRAVVADLAFGWRALTPPQRLRLAATAADMGRADRIALRAALAAEPGGDDMLARLNWPPDEGAPP